jgi:hypothetical protein
VKESKTFQQRYYLTTTNPLRRLVRNADLLVYILRVIWTWAVRGGQVRRAHQRALKSGQPMEIDFLAESPEVKRQRR